MFFFFFLLQWYELINIFEYRTKVNSIVIDYVQKAEV